nr:MAG TPA: Putative ATP dependent Clp protease [Caudoviricetes sp.]
MRIDIKGTIVSDDDAWIYEWFGIEHCSPKMVSAALIKAAGTEVDIYINSGGGSVFAGSDIYSEIRAYKGRVNLHVTGLAASAASVIACAGPSDISPTAMLMVHNVWSADDGDYRVMDKNSEILKKANEAIAAAYVAKTGMSQREALAMMDAETWLSAADAVEKGLIDKISEPQNLRLVAACGCTVLPQEVIEKIRNTVKPAGANASAALIENARARLKYLNMKGKEIK